MSDMTTKVPAVGAAAPAASTTAPLYRERIFHAADDVPIYFRDYGDPASPRPVVLCLAGLTRNSKDFHLLASQLAPQRRVLCMDYRGRGRSGYDPDYNNYHPRTYIADAVELLKVADAPKVVVIGTSLGGICAMGLGAAAPTRLAGVVLNDVGPTIDTQGLTRIAGYVGQEVRMPTLAAAAAALQAQFSPAYPDAGPALWLEMANGVFIIDTARGDYRLDYDLKLGTALQAQAQVQAAGPAPDLWPLFRSLRHVPVLAVRGALSDLLSQATFDRMAVENPDLQRLVVPNRGHIPLPHEQPLLSAIEAFLDRI